MTVIGGWHMPENDKYFEKFIPEKGPLPKQNGFQRDHLMKALHYVESWGIALDVGAHVGFWTRDMAELFIRVHAFEPAPDTYQCLVKNTDDLPNVVLHNVGVGSKPGMCRVRHDPKRERGGNTGSRFIQPYAEGDCQLVTIDSLDLPGCDFIKADVEGYEYHVLKGAEKTIRKFKPVICIECMPAAKNFQHRYDMAHGMAEAFLRTEVGYKEAAHLRPDRIYVPA